MKVKFTVTYYAPTDVVQVDKLRSVGGRRYKKNYVYDLSERDLEQVRKDGAKFQVLDKNYKEPKDEDVAVTLKDFDMDRANSDALIAAGEEAEAAIVKRGRGRPRKNPD